MKNNKYYLIDIDILQSSKNIEKEFLEIVNENFLSLIDNSMKNNTCACLKELSKNKKRTFYCNKSCDEYNKYKEYFIKEVENYLISKDWKIEINNDTLITCIKVLNTTQKFELNFYKDCFKFDLYNYLVLNNVKTYQVIATKIHIYSLKDLKTFLKICGTKN